MEIRETPWNGLTVASTFSGAGGSSLGYGKSVAVSTETVDEGQAHLDALHEMLDRRERIEAGKLEDDKVVG
jgi:hypothetical protein